MAPNTLTTTSGVTYTLKELWNKACEHDGITAASKFIVFSKDNPWMAQYNRLMALRYMQGKLGQRNREGVTMTDPQLVAMALLYRAQMYCMYMADRQRGTQSDDRRRAYNAAAVLLREARERIGQ